MAEWKELRARLVSEKARLETALKRLDRLDLRDSLKDSVNELSSYDNHPADLASETFEREKDLGILDSLRIRWRNISHALERIDKGKYGTCEECGKTIDVDRLEAIPETALCIDCQSEREELSSERERPLEEEVLGPPFGRVFSGGSGNVGFDGEDAWQAVARYGTSETPQDTGRGVASYDEMDPNQ